METAPSAANVAATDTAIPNAVVTFGQNTYKKIIAIAQVSVVTASGSSAQVVSLKLKIGTDIAGNTSTVAVTTANAANTHTRTIVAVGEAKEGASVVVSEGAAGADSTTTITVNNILVFAQT